MISKTIATAAVSLMALTQSSYVQAEELKPYFIQTFDDTSLVSSEQAATEYAATVEGQGEWLFKNAYVVLGASMKTNYVKDGSPADLRMVKGGSYVVTPIVGEGIGKVTFDEGRTKKYLRVYTSKDGGQTWTQVKEFSKNTALNNTVSVNDPQANRVKLENYNGSNDCDIDNLAVYPYDPEAGGGGEIPVPDNGIIETFWCSPDGDDATADGSQEKPFFSLQRAANLAGPGDTIIMKGGTYVYNARVNIGNCGTKEKLITLKCADGRAVLDFSAMPYHKHSDNPQQGIRLTASYWHFYHIDICNASDNGLLIERESADGFPENQAHDNLIEACNFYKNGDTGLQMKNLASFNRVINCDSYLNCDEDEGDADGFAPKISVGDGNYFYGCRAWANSDDGWDVFYKKESGQKDNVCVILENCIAYKNGFLDLQTIAPSGNGNGFKCGSDQGAMNVFMNRCLAIHNKAKGFDQNHNAGDIILNNCTGMTSKALCGDKTYSYRIYEEIASDHEVRLTNCIAINDNDATDKRDKQGNIKDGEHGKYGQYGRFEVDASLDRLSIVNCEFQKADPTQFVSITNDEELIGERQENGELPETTFAHLVDGSPLIDAGVKIDATTYRGIQVNGIEFADEAPDLGAYEKGTIVSGIERVEWADEPISVQQTEGGLTLLTVGGQTTALRLPNSRGRIVVMQVMKDGKPVGHVKLLMRGER
ncbi:MAG: right-handed parallel beta-helix repeat-containing protein [Prevotella sp.]|nr:right-handed parallel beta-helix repeat-containing protein [Prevotella sp.]